MNTTQHLSLKKPESNDYVDVQDFNDNADILEGAICPTATKTTPVDGDTVVIADSGDDGAKKQLTFANLKTWGRAIWAAVTHVHAQSDVTGLDAALSGKSPTTHTHSATDVGADATGTATSAVSAHNINAVAHSGLTATQIAAAASLTTLDAGDTVPFTDVSASNAIKKITWANIKVVLKAYFDTLYNKVTVNNTLTSTSTTEALSAAQGKALGDKIGDIDATLDAINGEAI